MPRQFSELVFRAGMVKIGIGYDIHPFARGRKLILGGIEIPHNRGLRGHSDADVLLHAICDAILGSISAGDIGYHFPNTDARFKGISSLVLADEVRKILLSKKGKIINIDSTIVAEIPRISPFIAKMQTQIANVFRLNPGQISIKATTNEGIGAIGRGEGMACIAAVSIEAEE